MLPLFPPIKPYARHRVKVDDVHELYMDESGTLDGIPVVFLHGGPGSGCEFDSRCFFDPKKFRIILFDQRGAGRSTPHGELTDNNTDELVLDLERIREFAGVEKWMLFGGGWGSALALKYAEAHPNRVLSLVLRGIFLGSASEIHWVYQQGTSQFFPDHWEDFLRPIPESERDDLVGAYARQMQGTNELQRMAAAKAWSAWSAHCATVQTHQRLIKHYSDAHRALSRCRIGTHYFANECFLEPGELLANIDRIKHLPATIVHGRFDMVCPLKNAFRLHRSWPGAQLFIVRDAGHAATEPTIIDALVRATRDMASRFEDDFGI
jgi:proline iminopeptidase